MLEGHLQTLPVCAHDYEQIFADDNKTTQPREDDYDEEEDVNDGAEENSSAMPPREEADGDSSLNERVLVDDGNSYDMSPRRDFHGKRLFVDGESTTQRSMVAGQLGRFLDKRDYGRPPRRDFGGKWVFVSDGKWVFVSDESKCI
ncbi:unnamed protein product [Cylicostephanus goldi]|uniref:Uncharacterized protein n=1 Tax=Cylicostephanus goldi TaxID=71465 RepID=A0A3P6RSC5_CYLGO|nr:unnamed protein product [Cylicostephanus goldi]